MLAAALDAELIRLQCYEGLDVGQARVRVELPAQLLEISHVEAARARPPARDGASCF